MRSRIASLNEFLRTPLDFSGMEGEEHDLENIRTLSKKAFLKQAV